MWFSGMLLGYRVGRGKKKKKKKKGVDDFTEGLVLGGCCGLWHWCRQHANVKEKKKTRQREKFWCFFFFIFYFFNCCQGTSVAVSVPVGWWTTAAFPSIRCWKWAKRVRHSALESICNNSSSRKHVNSHISLALTSQCSEFSSEWLADRQKLPDWFQLWTAIEDSGDFANINTICGLQRSCVVCPPGIGLRGSPPCWTSIHPSCQSCL